MNNWLAKGQLFATQGLKKLFKSERGDTNFISIIVILGIVVILAGVFIGFKDQIIGAVSGIIDGFTLS